MSTTFHTPQQAVAWLGERITGTLCADSRQLKKGDGFLAWPGAASDARQHVRAALQAGASACLVEQAGAEAFGFADDRIAFYPALKAAAAPIAAGYYGHPSHEMAMLAVTGTNGKTSTAWWLAETLAVLAKPAAVVGTLGIGQPGAMVFNGLTTPDPVLFHQQLRRLVSDGVVACAVEASSIGLAENRLDATCIHTAIFTNFTQDHLDYHGSMQAYWAAKKSLFSWPELRAAVVNVDDLHGAELAGSLKAESAGLIDVWTVSCAPSAPAANLARLHARNIVHGTDCVSFEVHEAGEPCGKVVAPVVGLYNVSNLLGVIGALRSLGLGLEDAARACSQVTPVPGRMDTLSFPGRPLAVIDYAHTPDALDKVLQALKPLAASRGGKLWCVFGCGGDRDPIKRPLMASVAEAVADTLVVTSDNPRSEDPAHIAAAMMAGFAEPGAVHVELDRALAIAHALRHAAPADVVLIAGKGHEHYQDIKGVKLNFSDKEQASLALMARASSSTADGAHVPEVAA